MLVAYSSRDIDRSISSCEFNVMTHEFDNLPIVFPFPFSKSLWLSYETNQKNR